MSRKNFVGKSSLEECTKRTNPICEIFTRRSRYDSFFKRLSTLCDMQGTNITSVVKRCGIATGAPTKWKLNDAIPNRTSLEKLARFFNVSVDYLLGAEEGEQSKGKWIPVLGRVAAGLPIEAIEDVVDQEQSHQPHHKNEKTEEVKILGFPLFLRVFGLFDSAVFVSLFPLKMHF